jgi:hypothetical protein
MKFLKYTDIDVIFKKLNWNERPAEERKCVVCNVQVTKENIGAFTSSYKPVCNKFSCLIATLFKDLK